MRLLVTGGAGFIGANFVRAAVQERAGVSVTVLDALTYAGSRESLRAVEDQIRMVEGDLTDATPATYAAMRVIYELSRADGLDPAKVERAVQLSKEKYCGVSAMLKHAADIHFEIRWVD